MTFSIGSPYPIDPERYRMGEQDAKIKQEMCNLVELLNNVIHSIDPTGKNPSLAYLEQRLDVITNTIDSGDFKKMDMAQCKEMFNQIIEAFNGAGGQGFPHLQSDPQQAFDSLLAYCKEHHIPTGLFG